MNKRQQNSDTPLKMTSLYNKNFNPNDDESEINAPTTSAAAANVQRKKSESIEPEVRIIDPGKKQARKHSFNIASATDSINNIAISQVARRSSQDNMTGTDDANEDEDEEAELILKYDAQHVIKIFKPVTLCLIIVIICLSFITSYQKSGGQQLIYTPFNEESQTSGTKLWMSIANASIFICVVVVMTILLIVLYKCKCYKVIHGWLAFSSLMLLFLFTYMFISEFVKQFNLITDMITVCFLLFNFGVVGMVSIHWKGPLVLQQGFLIFTCLQMALIFIKYLPEWTTWVLLAFISIWDLIAVLCPFGPLRILVETAKSRNDQLFPAMVYSSTIIYTMMADVDVVPKQHTKNKSEHALINTTSAEIAVSTSQLADSNTNVDQQRHSSVSNDEDDGGFKELNKYAPAQNRGEQRESEMTRRRQGNQFNPRLRTSLNREIVEELEHQQEEEEENGVKLGLGDFIFYSILVGKASILGDWNTVIACFVAILIGLCMTLILLAIFRKPLPALPISLFFGLIFYFSTNLLVRPFYDQLTFRQVFI